MLTELFELNSKKKLDDMARDLTFEIENGAFDVVCELSEQYFYYTQPWYKALELGSRFYSLAGLNVDSFIRCVGKVNHVAIFQFGTLLKEILNDANTIQIVSEKGTKIDFQMDNNLVLRLISRLETNLAFRLVFRLQRKFISKLTRKQRSCVTNPSSVEVKRGESAFMGGQLGFMGIPETIEGTAVIDGYLWPPKEIGSIDDPIILDIKKGNVVRISGCPLKSKILNTWFDGEPREIIHFLCGFNPGAKLSGKIMEAERAFGNISIGIGKYPLHTDGIIKNPSLIIDDKVIEQYGSFVHKELSNLEKNLTQDFEN